MYQYFLEKVAVSLQARNNKIYMQYLTRAFGSKEGIRAAYAKEPSNVGLFHGTYANAAPRIMDEGLKVHKTRCGTGAFMGTKRIATNYADLDSHNSGAMFQLKGPKEVTQAGLQYPDPKRLYTRSDMNLHNTTKSNATEAVYNGYLDDLKGKANKEGMRRSTTYADTPNARVRGEAYNKKLYADDATYDRAEDTIYANKRHRFQSPMFSGRVDGLQKNITNRLYRESLPKPDDVEAVKHKLTKDSYTNAYKNDGSAEGVHFIDSLDAGYIKRVR